MGFTRLEDDDDEEGSVASNGSDGRPCAEARQHFRAYVRVRVRVWVRVRVGVGVGFGVRVRV